MTIKNMMFEKKKSQRSERRSEIKIVDTVSIISSSNALFMIRNEWGSWAKLLTADPDFHWVSSGNL